MAIEGADVIRAAAFIGAGIAMGFGAIGPGIGEGLVAARPANPNHACWSSGCRVNRNIFTGYCVIAFICCVIYIINFFGPITPKKVDSNISLKI